MIPGVLPIGQYGTDVLPASEDLSTPNPFWGFFNDPYANRIFVLCVAPMPLTGASDTFFYPLGHNPIGWLSDVDKRVPDVLYYANKELATGSTDVPPNTVMPSRLVNALNFRASIPLPSGTSSKGSSSFGFIRVANTGDLDNQAIGSSWVGREAIVWIGGTMNPGRSSEKVLQFQEYQKLYTLQISGVTVNEMYFDLSVRDPVYKLRIPIQQSTYAGDATDYEGGDDVKGQYKPVALGACFKLPGVLVNATEYIYQYHDGSGTTVSDVWDNGIALSLQEDSTDLPNLSVTTGNYATDVSRGLVKIGDEPSSEIVIDCVGIGGLTISSILEYLADLAGVAIDAVAFNSVGKQAAGFWCDTSAIDIFTVFTELMTSIDGWLIFKRNGKLAIGRHLPIHRAASVLTLDGRQFSTPNVSLGSERHTGADASAIGTEADSIGNWVKTSNTTLTSQNSVTYGGGFALEMELNTVNGASHRATLDLDTEYSLVDGIEYQLSVAIQHVGTGGAWRVAMGSAETINDGPIIDSAVTSTSWAIYTITFTHGSTTRFFGGKEESGTDDGGIYLDNLSIKRTPDGSTSGIVSSIVENTLRRSPGPPPVWEYKLGYKKYGATVVIDEDRFEEQLHKKFHRDRRRRWRKHGSFKLADTVNPDQISDWAQEFRKVDTVSNPSTKDYYFDAVSIEKDTHLTTESEVSALANGYLKRDSKLRGLYSFRIARDLYKLFPGDVITVRHDRFGLSAGKKGRIISMVEDAATETTELQVLINE